MNAIIVCSQVNIDTRPMQLLPNKFWFFLEPLDAHQYQFLIRNISKKIPFKLFFFCFTWSNVTSEWKFLSFFHTRDVNVQACLEHEMLHHNDDESIFPVNQETQKKQHIKNNCSSPESFTIIKVSIVCHSVNDTAQTDIHTCIYLCLRRSKSYLPWWKLWPAHWSWRAVSPERIVRHARYIVISSRSNGDVMSNTRRLKMYMCHVIKRKYGEYINSSVTVREK